MKKNLWVCLCCIFVCFNETSAQLNETFATTAASTTTLASVSSQHDTKTSPEAKQANKGQNETVEMHRITQPIVETHSQTQQIGRTLFPALKGNENQSINLNFRPTAPPEFDNASPTVRPKDFRPSPQLDTYYEYNRFPVAPALPEAKHFSGISLNEKPETVRPWLDKPLSFPSPAPPTSWYSNRVNFPTTIKSPFPTVKDHPYPYVITGSYPETSTGSPFQYLPPETTTAKGGGGIGGRYPSPGGSSQPSFISDKFGGSFFGVGAEKGPVLQKNHYDYPSPSYPISPSPSNGGDMSLSSAWKKIIKFLTAVIPIGLFLTALTPTVINVAPANNTQNRGRAEGNLGHHQNKLLSSLKYINGLKSAGCEERVVCELLLGASSSANAEQHVENLLGAFTDKERDVLQQVHELQKILEAVKGKDCSSLVCRSITEANTVKEDVEGDGDEGEKRGEQ